jgi:DNA-binding LacI/PurR family transcriptional regulator
LSITLKDVAKIAEVSTSTVSRVISNSSKISDETKIKVNKAIKDLGYHPNEIARSLSNNSTNILGLILPNSEIDLFSNPFFILLMKGISIYAHKKGYYIMYSFSKDEIEEIDLIKKYTNGRAVDGVILLKSMQNDKCIEYLKKIEYPFVVVGHPEQSEDILWVDNDNFQAMYNVVNKLILKGHKCIAFIGGNSKMNMSRDRLQGYTKALDIHGISYDENLVIEQNEFTEKCGYNGMMSIFKYKRPTAVVTTDDLLAFGAIEAINENNANEISIVGFNNILQIAYRYPKFSSVDINSEELGYSAAKLLINKIQSSNEILVNHFIVDTTFIDREEDPQQVNP